MGQFGRDLCDFVIVAMGSVSYELPCNDDIIRLMISKANSH